MAYTNQRQKKRKTIETSCLKAFLITDNINQQPNQRTQEVKNNFEKLRLKIHTFPEKRSHNAIDLLCSLT